MEWQPIETAPKDGTKILVFMACEHEIFASRYTHGCWQTGVWKSPPPHFSHWMPLPDPPA